MGILYYVYMIASKRLQVGGGGGSWYSFNTGMERLFYHFLLAARCNLHHLHANVFNCIYILHYNQGAHFDSLTD